MSVPAAGMATTVTATTETNFVRYEIVRCFDTRAKIHLVVEVGTGEAVGFGIEKRAVFGRQSEVKRTGHPQAGQEFIAQLAVQFQKVAVVLRHKPVARFGKVIRATPPRPDRQIRQYRPALIASAQAQPVVVGERVGQPVQRVVESMVAILIFG